MVDTEKLYVLIETRGNKQRVILRGTFGRCQNVMLHGFGGYIRPKGASLKIEEAILDTGKKREG